MLRFKTKGKIFDVAITAVAGMLSVCVMIYAICHFGLKESWPELVLNLFYVTCLTMMWMYFFNKLKPAQFNYWCSVLVGVTVLLLVLITYFYARKDWKSYTKRNMWLIFIVDMVIAVLYNYDIYMEPVDEYTPYLLTEIWIRPTITYGMVACFVSEQITQKNENAKH